MSKIEQQVMASVAVIYAIRQVTSVLAIKVYGVVFSFVGIAAFVSLSHVAANFTAVAGGGLSNIATFLLSAVLGTKLIVQLALAIGAVAFISLVADAVRSLAQSPRAFATQ